MANVIKIKSSGVSSNIPSTLENGEIAINYADGDIFYKNSSGSIKIFKTNPAIISNTAPTTDVKDGYLWFDTTTSNLYIRVSSAWVEATTGTVIALTDLSDVLLSTPEEFQTLEYDGTNWVNKHASVVSYVRNAEATTITTGTCVYLFGSTGDHASVKRADNGSDATSSKTIGVAGSNISAGQNGPIITRGYVDGINLSTGYVAGDVLWLGENGAFTKTKPTAPDHLVFIGVVVRATNNGIIYVATQNGYELDEIHDVSISGEQPNDYLKYNGSLWINGPAPLVVQNTAPSATDILWADTSTSGSMAIPSGGSAGQFLYKNSNTAYDTSWTWAGDEANVVLGARIFR